MSAAAELVLSVAGQGVDVTAITTLTSDSEGDGSYDGETWTEGTDFVLVGQEHPELSGPFTRFWVPGWATKGLVARRRYFKAVGSWGWATVPNQIRKACLARAKVDYDHYSELEVFAGETLGDYTYRRFSPANGRERELQQVRAFRRAGVATP